MFATRKLVHRMVREEGLKLLVVIGYVLTAGDEQPARGKHTPAFVDGGGQIGGVVQDLSGVDQINRPVGYWQMFAEGPEGIYRQITSELGERSQSHLRITIGIYCQHLGSTVAG